MTGHRPQRRLALLLEYDGSPYNGSQAQKNAPSIQGELETALCRLTGERLRVAFAGRTDAGVHAQGQVAAFTTTSALDTGVFVRGLNAHLPEEIAVRRAVEVAEGFDPRRHATGRTYRYTIYNARARSPLWRSRSWHLTEPLDISAMGQAAAVLIGEHDFAAFRRREVAGTDTRPVPAVRCLRRCDVAGRGPLVTIELEANAFLRQQVRRITGVLAQVGRGRMNVAGVGDLLQQGEAASAGPPAPAHGLCLLSVSYPGLDLTDSNRYDA